MFSFYLVIELLENMGIIEHTIKLKEIKQPPYGPIHSLDLMELKTLKTYIKIHLKTGFIQPFKPLAGALILFN